MPSRTYFRDKAIPEMYGQLKDIVIEDIHAAKFCALTTDGWTSRAQDGYITTTAHYLDNNWTLHTRVLDTTVLQEAHNGANLGKALKEISEKWGTNKMKGFNSVTTDNASVMTVAVQQSGHDIHVGCFAHTLNLATKKGLEVIANVFEICVSKDAFQISIKIILPLSYLPCRIVDGKKFQIHMK